ncbi:UNVERIFIED_CONTAM: hypothetical protein PYX00_010462 [Menopon gallinae]|uniref:N-acetyllactosaminide beta-1,3-N-acetylglucosaminyltransferase n=1 Tax=Menopon gallinae TaxID=328185 RepID=A0AAW2HFV1_9NEOP
MGSLFRYKNDFQYAFVIGKKHPKANGTFEKFTVASFLKNRKPGNVSHCTFRFGDSDSFNYTTDDISYTPELGDKSPYRVLYNVAEGIRYNATGPETITYATHVTLEYLLHIVEVATRWEGLISVACFLPGSDTGVALKILERLCYCVKEMEYVSVHFVYHWYHPPQLGEEDNSNGTRRLENVRNATAGYNKTRTETRCFVPERVLKSSYRYKLKLVYPVNVARNVARYGSRTKYILVSDIELLPSEHLVTEFLKMIERLKERSKEMGENYFTRKRHVFVLPVFEVVEDEPDVPRTKIQLLDLYDKERAVYFHRLVCLHCQRFPGLQRWLQRKMHPKIRPGTIQPLIVVKRVFPYHRWEPVYIGTNQEPLYNELLTWEGQQDKMTQMHEMCLQDYRFVILNGAFLVHTPGIKRQRDKINYNTLTDKTVQSGSKNRIIRLVNMENLFSSKKAAAVEFGSKEWRMEHMKRNAYLYEVITQDVISKYPRNPGCRVH